MAKIGNLGKLIVFEVSADKVLTFKSLSQSVKGRWATHNPIKRKPVSEFLGPDARSITMTVNLNAMLGVKPRATLSKIERAVEKGKPYTLVIGGEKIGKYKWVIASVSESWNTVMSKGELISCTLNLTLNEYWEAADDT